MRTYRRPHAECIHRRSFFEYFIFKCIRSPNWWRQNFYLLFYYRSVSNFHHLFDNLIQQLRLKKHLITNSAGFLNSTWEKLHLKVEYCTRVIIPNSIIIDMTFKRVLAGVGNNLSTAFRCVLYPFK
jgi:hypothetical protein